jgi:glycosyltransferase involved in cell wall biosynthesis
MTRIAVDATSVSPSGKGLSRVQSGTVQALAALSHPGLVAYVGADVDLGVPSVRVRRRPALLWEQVGLARAGRRADVVLTWTDRLPVSGGPFVVWLFEVPTRRIDQNRLARAGWYQRGSDLLTGMLWRGSLRRAACVLAGSSATAAELQAAAPEVREARVLYPGLDATFAPGTGRDGRYVLHIASSDPRDNTPAVVAAVGRANTRLREPVQLLVAGADGADGERVEFLGRVSDEDLVELYRGAAAYLDASLFEGFGYQPLEAMACGTPVIAANGPSALEVVGDAGILCDPRDVEARAAALVRVLEEPGLGQELRRRGLERAETFSWERTARQLLEVIDEVVD